MLKLQLILDIVLAKYVLHNGLSGAALLPGNVEVDLLVDEDIRHVSEPVLHPAQEAGHRLGGDVVNVPSIHSAITIGIQGAEHLLQPLLALISPLLNLGYMDNVTLHNLN